MLKVSFLSLLTGFAFSFPVLASGENVLNPDVKMKFVPGVQMSTKALYSRHAQVEHIEALSAGPINPLLDEIFTKKIPCKFERQEWIKAGSRTKWLMIYDLIHSHSLIGMSRRQLVELIGEPSEDPYTKAHACDINVSAYEARDGFYFQVLYLDNRVAAYRLKSNSNAGTPIFSYSNWITKNFSEEK